MKKLSTIGLMSGSSLDGVDLAWCTFSFSEAPSRELLEWQLIKGTTIPYPREWQQRLRAAPNLSGRDLWLLHTELGLYFGAVVSDFMSSLAGEVDFVASHGHTVFHFPDQQTTTQIGDGAAMAGVLDRIVIDQFRTLDMALGGQGAPLAPLADQYLLGHYFACLNLGGISNISVKTPEGGYVAFDVGGANQVLDALVQEIGLSYDDDGQLARSGLLVPDLLAAANQLPFHALSAPKSLGNDWVREQLLPLFQQSSASLADRLHTCCFHIAEQIGNAVRKVIANEQLTLRGQETMLVAGGGGFNGFLCELIEKAIAPIQLERASPDMIAYKEAALMALAGALRWLEQPNVLPSVTGARRAAVGGAIHWGKPKA